MDTTKRNRISQLLGTMANVQGHEIKAVAGSFLFVVLLMSAYYILRPVRDAMASDWSDAEVSWLWTLNFFISTAVVALYGALVARFPLRLLVPATYGIFALTFLVFYALALAINDRTLIDKSFYVWVSVFSLFHISVFWCFMSELFNKEQAGRLFGIIAAGASVGGLIGPSIPLFFRRTWAPTPYYCSPAHCCYCRSPLFFIYKYSRHQTSTTRHRRRNLFLPELAVTHLQGLPY